MSVINWVDKTLAVAVHERQLAEHGGSAGLRDEALLDSALARPRQLFAYGVPEPDLAALAAALAYGLARNHPFVDGNKRTAQVCYRVFLLLNGATLVASDEEKYIAMLSLAEGTWSEDDFAAFLRRHLVLKPPGQRVQEPRPARRAAR